MKVLRGFSNIILGLILFIIIFSLSFIINTKSFIKSDAIVNTVKEEIKKGINKETNPLNKKQKEKITNIIEDEETLKVITKVVDNYKNYRKNDKYELSKKDYEFLFSYIDRYKEEIILIAGNDKNVIENIKNNADYETTKKVINDAFNYIDDYIEEESITDIIDIYIEITSTKIMIIGIVLIIVCIGLLMLINKSYISWMRTLASALIFSSILLIIIFVGSEVLKDYFKDVAIIPIDNIKMTGFLITGILELLLGIALEVTNKIIKKKIETDN